MGPPITFFPARDAEPTCRISVSVAGVPPRYLPGTVTPAIITRQPAELIALKRAGSFLSWSMVM